MANLSFAPGQSGLTLYVVIQRASDDFFVYANGSVIESYSAAHWPNYALAMTPVGVSGIYSATFPAVAAGSYTWVIRQQAGGSPVVDPATDIQRGIGGGDWSGTAFLGLQGAVVAGGTVTNLTNLPAVPANWLTATGIADGALNGKGDWLTETGELTAAEIWAYADRSLTQAVPIDPSQVVAAIESIIVVSGLSSGRWTHPDGSPVSTINLRQTMALLLAYSIGDRSGVGTREIIANLLGDVTKVQADRTSRDKIQASGVVPV